MRIVETSQDLREFFKRENIKIAIIGEPFRSNDIINVEKVNDIISQEEDIRDTIIQEINESNNRIVLLCNGLTVLPSWIESLENVNGFIILNTLNTSLFENMLHFSNIQVLYLLKVKTKAIPSSIKEFKKLKTLEICDSEIQDKSISDSIGELEELQSLKLVGTNIEYLPNAINRLTKLESLNISNTSVISLPDNIGDLCNLKTLDISDTSITELPNSIDKLDKLEHFYLYNLNIRKMPWFNNCKKGLDVFSTNFDRYIPFSIKHQPASLFMQAPEIIQQYYDEPKGEINNYKVIFLGYGNAGKTHTVQRLKEHGKLKDYNPEQTDGIDFYDEKYSYKGEEINLSFWDFGGQDELYSMHRCFLTERACYVVVVSNRLHESLQKQARYWLRNISIFAKKSTVVIAINNFENTYSEGINTEQLREEFPEIIIGDAISYSAKRSSEEQFNQLTDAILRQIHNLDGYKMEFPLNWIGIINEIKNNRSGCISKKEFRKICQDNNVESPEIRKWLLSWFHDLGYCFCNHLDLRTGEELEKYQLLNPNWITTALYRINHAYDALNGDKVYVDDIDFKKGTIAPSTLYFLVNDEDLSSHKSQSYNRTEVNYILNVMRKFKLSYQVEKGKEFIPVLCRKSKPANLYENTKGESISYYVKYSYLPDNIIHRIMIDLYQKGCRLSFVWRYGFRIDIGDGIHNESVQNVIVEMNSDNDTIEIVIKGDAAKNRWDCLMYMLNLISEINISSNCFSIEEYIVRKKENQIAHLPISSIIKAKEKKLSEIWSTDDGEYEAYPLEELIGDTFGEEVYDVALQDVENEYRNPYQAVVEARSRYHRMLQDYDGLLGVGSGFGNISINNYNGSVNNTIVVSEKDFLPLLEKVLKLPTLTESQIDEIQNSLGDENKELKAGLEKAKKNNEDRHSILTKALDNTNKAVELVDKGIETGGKVKKAIIATVPLVKTLAQIVGSLFVV